MSWEYVRWKPFNFVVGEGPAHEMVLISISGKSNSTKTYVCNFGGRSIKRFSTDYRRTPEGLPVAGSKTKAGLNRVKVIFYEVIKVAKRY